MVANVMRSLASTRRTPLLVVLVALAFTGLAGPADAKPHFGVHIGEANRSVDEWQRMALGEVAVVRRSFEYTSNVQQFDGVMRKTSDAGLRVLPVVMGTPDGGIDPPRSDSELDAFGSFTEELVERYGRNGTFWCDTPGNIGAGCAPIYRPITDWQILNEPSLDVFWAGDPNPREYARAVEVADDAIKSRDPEADTVLAGMPYDTARGMSLEKFIGKFYDVGGVRNDFDAAAVHPYGRDEDDVRFILERLRSKMKNANDGGTDVWVTEMGWATGGPDGPFRVSDSGQKKRLEKSFEFMEDDRKRYNLDTVVWYNWRDVDVEPDRFHHHTGLFEKNGDPKPAWSAFTDFTGGNDGGGAPVTSASAKAGVAPDPLAAPPSEEQLLPPPNGAAGE